MLLNGKSPSGPDTSAARRRAPAWLNRSLRLLLLGTVCWLGARAQSRGEPASTERTLELAGITGTPVSFQAEIGRSGEFTWWLPAGASEYVLPISAGVVVDASRSDLMRWLRNGSPWSLLELPVLGLRYGDQTLVVIVPWPHYAELIVDNRIGIRYAFPEGRHQATPCGIVAMRRGAGRLEAAAAFREWRRNAADTGAIPRPRPLERKLADLDQATRLLGAPHIYLWGPALFSRHDVPRKQWVAFAKALRGAAPESSGGRLVASFTDEARGALQELAAAEWPMDHLTVVVAGALDAALSRRAMLGPSPALPDSEVIRLNQQALAGAFGSYVNPPASWGDGPSNSLLDALHGAGVDRALLLLSDLYGRSLRPDIVARAEDLGYLLGPYDSYHSVHSPATGANGTWETARFDAAAYERGRVINADGSGHTGFKGVGYHFAPQAAWPYVEQRVGRLIRQAPYSAWFIDCDATAECFDDFSREHPATRIEDVVLRRQRLAWLETQHKLVVGSEGGSVLFADVIHFGHGVHTPYIGHLDPGFRDRRSPHFLGRHWPPDAPEQAFKPVPVPPSLKTPYFDPTVRLPLYQAALGDEVIATHHWSFDSLKFEDLEATRGLLEILYMAPPMYHLNRTTWPTRRARILRHLAFWGPLHRELATAPLTGFEYLSEDRLVQRTTFHTGRGEVTITVNFGGKPQAGHAAHSATVNGLTAVPMTVFRAAP
ncbi:MAG: hypothetical protein H7A45_15770 [Verrucomicrobiales bacterium]|nr:hypothetical protein [Verrucomicrobiales bacterium]